MTAMRPARGILAAAGFSLVLAACAGGGHVAEITKVPPVKRSAGFFKVGLPYVIGGVTYYPREVDSYDETGIASWYGAEFHGRSTANGETFDKFDLTAAHTTLPLPSLVRVTNLENGRSIVVRVNDRGPFHDRRIIDLSRRAAQLLDMERAGIARVRVQLLAKESFALQQAAREGRIMQASAVLENPSAPAPDRALEPTVGAAPRTPVEVETLPSLASVERVVPPPPSPDAVTVTTLPDRAVVVQQGGGEPVLGQMRDGVFRPAPIVTQQAVAPTTLYVQTGAFTQSANAQRAEAAVSRFGTTRIAPKSIDDTLFYRVQLGPFRTVADAERALTALERAGTRGARIVVE
jgi:rare lipoprotein A